MAGDSFTIWDTVSPIDFRYPQIELVPYLSEGAFIKYKLRVELALVQALHKLGLCDSEVVDEVKKACAKVTTQDVYDEEGRIRHDIRALVNCIQLLVSEAVKPLIHRSATSFDISDTANVARFREAIQNVVMPALIQLERILIEITEREAETLQIGRTHGQHAVPITFGFAMAQYVDRFGESIIEIKRLNNQLVGKFSGAVGAYNASSILFDDPEEFERTVLSFLCLKPARISTQIVHPESMLRLLAEVVTAAGIMANIARDMRNLQRTEIAEVGEEFEREQVGSSTMPQKRNPINFENVESMWKILVGRIQTVRLDQLSDHQRDLTNSASSRTYGEIICYFLEMTNRLERTMWKLQVDKRNLRRNFEMTKGMIVAEPLYIILAALGHPDAHEVVREITLKAQRESRNLEDVAQEDAGLKPYFEKMTSRQREILSDPALYIGIAPQKAHKAATYWRKALNIK